MKIYKKLHESKEVANIHIAKIKERGGNVKQFVQNGKILLEYSFLNNNEIILKNNSDELTIKKPFSTIVDLILYYDKSNNFYIGTAVIDNKEIARATFEYSKKLGGWFGNDIAVKPQYRRKGIMTSIYDWVEEKTNSKIVPSLSLSKDAKGFWSSRS
jgi:hypothetical protein